MVISFMGHCVCSSLRKKLKNRSSQLNVCLLSRNYFHTVNDVLCVLAFKLYDCENFFGF